MVLTNTNKLTLNAMRFMKRVIALFLGNTVKNQNYFNVEHYFVDWVYNKGLFRPI